MINRKRKKSCKSKLSFVFRKDKRRELNKIKKNGLSDYMFGPGKICVLF